MKFLKVILTLLTIFSINMEFGCASREAIKEYNKGEWVYLGNGTDLERFLTNNEIIFEVNPRGSIFIQRDVYKEINDKMRTGVLLCMAIPFDVATFPLQLMGFDHWSSPLARKSNGSNDSSGQSKVDGGKLIGVLLQAGFNHW